MNNQFQQNQNIEKPKKTYWKFVFGFLGIVVVIGGGFFVWNGYLSSEAKSRRQMEKQYEVYMEWEKRYLDALKQDTYGGKTPEETLKMFIDALKKEDIELASKYFALDTNENSENYLTRKEWEETLERAKKEGMLREIINTVLRAIPTENQELLGNTFWFSVYDDRGNVELLIELSRNSQSKVWKIINI